MKRTTYKELSCRCQATTRTGQCKRDATTMHAGKGYCGQHHAKKLEEKTK